MKTTILISFTLLLTLICQVEQTHAQDVKHEYTIQLSGDEVIETTALLGNQVLVSQVKEAVKSKYIPTRQYMLFDSVLSLQLDTTPKLPFRHKPKGGYASDTAHYDFFYDYRKGNYSLISITPHTFTVEHGALPNKMYEPQFVGGPQTNFFLDRRINKERIVIVDDDTTRYYSVGRKKKRTKVFPLLFNKVTNGSSVIYVWKEERKQDQDVYAAIWDADGTLEEEFSFRIPDKTVHGLSVFQVDEERLLFTGTYSNHASKEASGLFTAVVESGSVLQLHTYSFSDLPHYFDYLDQYDKAEMKRKLARLKKHEKSTEIKTHAFAQTAISVGNGYLLPIEFYSELFVNEYGITRNGNTIAGAPQSLKGYNYSHGLVLRLDEEGVLKHDYYFDLDLDQVALSKSPKLQTFVHGDTLFMGYASKNKFYFGNIKPLEFATLQPDSISSINKPPIVRKEARFFYMPDGSILAYGYKTERGMIGFRKKADIYFIEKRKVR